MIESIVLNVFRWRQVSIVVDTVTVFVVSVDVAIIIVNLSEVSIVPQRIASRIYVAVILMVYCVIFIISLSIF